MHTSLVDMEDRTSTAKTVVFVCEHGAAKSVIAALHLSRLAEQAGLAVRGVARGTEPEPTLSPAAVAGLRRDGLEVADLVPTCPDAEELSSAAVVVSFGPDLGRLVSAVPSVYWSDIPAVSDDYEAARAAIVARLGPLLTAIAGTDP